MENGSIQIGASTVEEAIEQGLARLGLSRGQVEVEIVDHGSRGLLGIGARDAVVVVKPLRATQPAAMEEEQAPAALEPEQVDEPETETPAYEWSERQVASVASQTLSELLGQMGLNCQVIVREEHSSDGELPPLTLDIEGEDIGVLIGRQGEVLDALQYITRLIVSREVEQWVNLVVDVEHYKERRAKSLQQLANRIADRVARTKQPVALEPMPPNERRTIHIALRDHPTVTTQSVGKGDRRKVTIIPKR